jgi:hypothetical protein
MKWRVNWLPDTEQELADLWLGAPDRNAVTHAAHVLDELLEADPEGSGESRPEGRRILFAAPLGVFYRVLPDSHIVEVVHVWRFEV